MSNISNVANSSLSEKGSAGQHFSINPKHALMHPSRPAQDLTGSLALDPFTPVYHRITCSIKDRSTTNSREFKVEATFRPGSQVSFISASAVRKYDLSCYPFAESFLKFFRSPLDDEFIRPTSFVKLALAVPGKEINVTVRILEQPCSPQMWIGDLMIAKHGLCKIFPQISWSLRTAEEQDSFDDDYNKPTLDDHGMNARDDSGQESVELAYTGAWSEISTLVMKPTTVPSADNTVEVELERVKDGKIH